eukprot:8839327-Alexandrium_andersonii.AAC.1
MRRALHFERLEPKDSRVPVESQAPVLLAERANKHSVSARLGDPPGRSCPWTNAGSLKGGSGVSLSAASARR